jgi:transposase
VTTIICGVDVSGATLDARIRRDGPHLRVERSCQGIAELAAFCRRHQASLVVMEASGGYEKLAFALLWQAGLACAIVNPRAVRRFAQAMGYLEKTDRIDAGVIAHYGAAMELEPQTPDTPAQARLEALALRLRQLTAMRAAQDNQRRLVEDATALVSIEQTVAFLSGQIRTLEAAIDACLGEDPLWTRLASAFRAIKGVADRTVATVLALMPEIGTLSNKAVAKLAGLAPIANDSGARSGRRPVRGGRAPLRALLVFIVGGVARHNQDFRAAHERLTRAGKPKLVIRVALARKLLVRLNAKAKEQRRLCQQTA